MRANPGPLCGGDGNLLLNVGPMPTGEIEPRQAQRLREIGSWLKQNGESIYGTRGGPFPPAKTYAATRKGHSVYVHLLAGDEESVNLPALKAVIVSARILGGGTVTAENGPSGLALKIPAAERLPIDTIVQLELDRPAAALPPALP